MRSHKAAQLADTSLPLIRADPDPHKRGEVLGARPTLSRAHCARGAKRSEAGEGLYLISLGFRYRQLSNRSQRPPDVA